MAITTLAAAISGIQPIILPFSKNAVGGHTASLKGGTTWACGGSPVAGVYDTTLNGVALTAPVTGQLPWNDPTAGNAYLARLQFSLNCLNSSQIHITTLMLCDRLWHNGNYDATSTTAQNSTTPTWPARDELGGTAGQGIFLALEVSAVMGAAAPTITIAYTDSDNAAQTSTSIVDGSSGQAVRSWIPIGIAAASRGVKSVQSLTLSTSWVSGTMNLVAYRPIMLIPVITNNRSIAVDAISGAMPRIFNGSVLFFVNWTQLLGSNEVLSGHTEFTWG